MKKYMISLFLMTIPSAAYADIGPHRSLSCEECIFRCYDCCNMKEIVPMPGCGSCYHGSCDYEAVCAAYLADNPDKCPGRQNADNSEPSDDASRQDNSPEKVAVVDKPNTIEDQSQVPPPVATKRSCSAMMLVSGQTGIWAILSVLLLCSLTYLVRRRGR